MIVRRVVQALVVALGFAGWPVLASAQTGETPRRVEISAGGQWDASMPVGTASAQLTTAPGGAFPLFTARTELARALFFDVRVGTRVWKRLRAEGALSYGETQLATAVSGDIEAVSVLADEAIQRWSFDGQVAIDLRADRDGRRVLPFVGTGGGVVRYAHQGRTLVETGGRGFVNAGLRLVLSRPPGNAAKAFGVRVDGRLSAVSGGLLPPGRTEVVPGLGFSVFVQY